MIDLRPFIGCHTTAEGCCVRNRDKRSSMIRTQLAAQVVWHPSRVLLCSAIIALLLIACAPLALAQPAEEAPAEGVAPPQVEVEPQPALVLRELIVLQADRYGDTANNPNLIETTLFPPIRQKGRTKRTGQDGNYEFAPMPLGLMTFEGVIDEPIKLRLTLKNKRDAFHAHWPNNAIAGEQLLQWQGLSAAGEQDRSAPITQKEDWLDPLRGSEDRVWFQSPSGEYKERFLLYDASFAFKPALEVTFAEGQYGLKAKPDQQAAPPLTLLVRKNDQGWSADAIASPWPKPNPPIADKVSSSTASPSVKQALGPMKDLLAERDYNEKEITLALGMIAAAGFETSNFALVYVMPDQAIDEHIRLQIRPMPDQVIRTAIVVVNNVDPNLGSQVNALLDDLGSDQWIKRDRAQRELIKRSQAAIKKVQQLKNHPDPEIAFRAQQIIDAHEWKMSGNK